jgi:ABC-2 type transport system permease protein
MRGLVLPVVTLWQRELVRFYRQRDRVLGAVATPLLFWAVIGSGFGASFRSHTGYLEYLFPGTIILSVLFTAIFSTISIIEDRREGFLQSVLVAPVSRAGMVLGKVLGSTTIAAGQGTAFLLFAPLLTIPVTYYSLFGTVLILCIIAFALSNLGFFIAWRSDSTQGFHAIMNLFLIPLWLLSGAFFPAAGSPFWIGWIIHLNPLTYGVAALRRALYASLPEASSLPSLRLSLAVMVLFAVISFAVAVFTAGRQSAKDLPG